MAAPTAGLHFTPQILEAITASGVEMARVTLHVGLGTFAPLRVERVDEVRLHRESYTLGAEHGRNREPRVARRPAYRGRGHHGRSHPGNGSARAADGPLKPHTG